MRRRERERAVGSGDKGEALIRGEKAKAEGIRGVLMSGLRCRLL